MLHVLRLLGNKNGKNTPVYMQLVDFEDCVCAHAFGSFIILPLLTIATLLAGIVYKRKRMRVRKR
jgi:hypothetical protein